MRITKAIFWLLLALVGPVAHAQGTDPDPDIVVRGQKAITSKEAKQFVQTVMTTEVDGQFARFDAPICPVVMGLSRRVAVPIENRIRDVALAAGASVAKGKCQGNVYLVAAQNADEWVKRFIKRYPAPFEDMWPTERNKLKVSSRVHSWRVVELQNENGQPKQCIPTMVCTLQVYTASHIRTPFKQVTMNAVVVIEQEIVFQKTVPQVADYVAMRALSGATPTDTAGAGTILALFAPGNNAPVPELTEVDLGLLKGLYHTPQNTTAHRQVNDIANDISRLSAAENGKTH